MKRDLLVERARPEVEPVVRFETAPGQQGRGDFAKVLLPWGRRQVLAVVLGSSRLLWFRCCERQTMWTLTRGLGEAFAYFAGVPKELLFDQMKVGGGGPPRFGRRGAARTGSSSGSWLTATFG